MQEFSQVFFRIYCGVFFGFLLHSFSDLLHWFGCMMVSCGSPIFGVRFCDTGVGVARDDVAIKFWPWLFSCSSTGLKQEFQHSSLCLPVYSICSPFLCLGGLRVGVQFLFHLLSL